VTTQDDTALYQDPTFDQYVAAEVRTESGGDYSAVSSAGAIGAYQIMPANIPSWSQAALGHPDTPSQFKASPQVPQSPR
jgi:hypothetical protein